MRSQLRDRNRTVVCALPAGPPSRRSIASRDVDARGARPERTSLAEMAHETLRQSDEAITKALTDPELTDSDIGE